jgi:hypothetical protein
MRLEILPHPALWRRGCESHKKVCADHRRWEIDDHAFDQLPGTPKPANAAASNELKCEVRRTQKKKDKWAYDKTDLNDGPKVI